MYQRRLFIRAHVKLPHEYKDVVGGQLVPIKWTPEHPNPLHHFLAESFGHPT